MAHTLYAASLLNAHRNGTESELREDERRAIRAIETALRDEPDTVIDGEQFDLRFSTLFNSVRDRLQPELTRIRETRVRAAQLAAQEREARRAEALRLMTTETRVEGGRWTCVLPFGGAQFANHQPALGWVFFSIETALLATSATTYFLQQSVDPATISATDQTLQFRVRAIEVVNYVSVSLLAATIVGGAIQAFVAYSPATRTLTRPLPPSLQNVQISLSPGAQGASLTFAF